MSWSTRARRKGIPKRLHEVLQVFSKSPNSSKIDIIYQYVHQLNVTFNNEIYPTDNENLYQILCQKIYRDDTVKMIINNMPFFPQSLLNEISTLLQTTIRQFPNMSLPSYLMNNPDLVLNLNSYLNLAEHTGVSTVVHILLRACTCQEEFLSFLFDFGVVSSFIQYFSSSSVDQLGAAFSTYDYFLNYNIEISSQYISHHWEIFSTHFKLIMTSTNYIVHLYFIPIFLKFITARACNPLFMRYLADTQNLELVMRLLGKINTKRIQFNAYAIFKLFVLNPRRTEPISRILSLNKDPLLQFLRDFSFDLETESELEDEKHQVIQIIQSL